MVSGDPSTGDFQFFFDGAGRFFKEQYPDGKIVQHVLDANGNMTKTTWPDGYYVDRVYDELNRQTDIKLNGSGTAAAHFDWDPLSRRKKLTFQNGVVTDYTYLLTAAKKRGNPADISGAWTRVKREGRRVASLLL